MYLHISLYLEYNNILEDCPLDNIHRFECYKYHDRTFRANSFAQMF